MKIVSEVSSDKLRGGFYTPESLVRVCLDRVRGLIGQRTDLAVFEPSAGDGAFIRGLESHRLLAQVGSITAVELDHAEAAKCNAAADLIGLPTQVFTGSVLNGVRASLGSYDVALGNPPFVRYQFVSEHDRIGTRMVERDAGCVLAGVSNLWIPVLLTALTRLTSGGAFAFVIPTECFTGISARVMRTWLLENCSHLQADFFPVGSFPGALQEVIVLSGRRAHGRPELRVVEHSPSGLRKWKHRIAAHAETWTRYLLTPVQVAAYEEAQSLDDFASVSDVARFTVATVTGANDYFSLSDATAKANGLSRWTRPLLPRIRYAAGLTYTADDHESLRVAGDSCWMLDVAASKADPLRSAGPRRYLEAGEEEGLHLRYKTSIRTPWFAVPVVAPGTMLLSKRSHRYPRLVLNEACVVTTDTIYQGSVKPGAGVEPSDIVGAFHNSLTLLSSEIEGRSFGGGVLELVPSEIARLLIPTPSGFGTELGRLDAVARSSGADSEDLIDETDRLLAKYLQGSAGDLMEVIREARASLSSRRLARTLS